MSCIELVHRGGGGLDTMCWQGHSIFHTRNSLYIEHQIWHVFGHKQGQENYDPLQLHPYEEHLPANSGFVMNMLR